MLSTGDIKRKIHSIGNTMQITKAMEMVAASKMRKSQLIALGSRPYCEKVLELLGNLSERTSYEYHPLLRKRPIKKSAFLVVTSDKGLCGGLNANVLKKIQASFKEKGGADIIAVGKKGRDFFNSHKYNVIAEFHGMGDYVAIKDTSPIADFLINLYVSEKYDLITAAFTNFFSTLRQEATIRQILPIDIEEIKKMVAAIIPERGRYADLKEEKKEEKIAYSYHYEYKFEPSIVEILEELMPVLLQIQIHHMILESNASEHSARMMAMKNASENAKNLLQELSLAYNKLRQSAITKEISETTAGKEALGG